MSELLSQLNLHHLRVFRVVAKRLSYSRAAEELLISQPAVSRHVHALEREVGSELLGQVGNRVFLTEAGRVVLSYAERMVDLATETARALAELENLERGYLRLGASSTPGLYLIPPLFAAFQARYPGVEVSLRLANSQQVAEEVLRGALDLGFVGAGFLPELQLRPYVQDELTVVAAPSHQFAERGPIAAADLSEITLVVREEGSGTRRVLEDELTRVGVTPRRVLELNGCEAVKRAVIAGMGIAAVSAFSVVLELRYGLLRRLHMPELQLRRDLYVVTRKDIRPSVAALAFLAHVRKAPKPSPETGD